MEGKAKLVSSAFAPPLDFEGEEPSVSRIVSLAPSNTEIAFFLGLGAQVVGVCDDSDYPAEVEPLARVGRDLQIDSGKVAALRPDLVLASLSVPRMESCVEAVRSEGLDALVLDPKRLEDVFADIEAVGRAAGVPQRARALVRWMRERFSRVGAAVEGLDRPRVLWEWWPRPLIVPGAQSWMVDVLRIAGGELIHPEPTRESFVLEEPRALLADPEVVVLCWCGTLQRVQDPAKVYARKGWQSVRALIDRRVFGVEEALFGRPGPRLADGALALAKILHPGVRL